MDLKDYIEYAVIAMLMLGYAVGNFRKGQFNRRKDDLEGKKDAFVLMQDQVEALEKLCKKQQEEIIEMRVRADEREKKAKEYIEIFQNRNPEMLVFMNYVTTVAKASEAYMKDTSLLFTTLKPVLEKIEKHLEKPDALLSTK